MNWFFTSKKKQNEDKSDGIQEKEAPETELDKTKGKMSFQGQYWKITFERYKTGKWDKIFASNQELEPRFFELSVGLGKNLDIPRQISNIKFPHLVALYLNNNQIISIECLYRLDAPNLLDLDLRNNCITNIKSLRKLSMRLDHLLLAVNPLTEVTGLASVWFYQQEQKSYVTSYGQEIIFNWNFNRGNINYYNISEFAKAEGHKIFDKIQSKYRFQPRETSALNQKQIQSVMMKACN